MAIASDAVTRRYELLRKRARQETQASTQAQQEALRRRFASIGSLGSGAAIKSEQLAAEAGAKQYRKAAEDIGMQEQAERQRLQEIEEARKYQTSEREAGQAFGAEQAEKSRLFATGERIGGQQFAGQQAALQRRFATSERIGGQQFAGQQASLQRSFQRGERLGAQDFAAGESAAQRAIQERALTEQERAAKAGEAFAEKQLLVQKDQFNEQIQQTALSREMQERIATADREWQKYVFNKEFPENVRIANANIATQRQLIEQGGGGVFESIFGRNSEGQIFPGITSGSRDVQTIARYANPIITGTSNIVSKALGL